MLRWYGTRSVLVLCWYCTGTALAQHKYWYFIGTALALHRCCSGTMLVLRCTHTRARANGRSSSVAPASPMQVRCAAIGTEAQRDTGAFAWAPAPDGASSSRRMPLEASRKRAKMNLGGVCGRPAPEGLDREPTREVDAGSAARRPQMRPRSTPSRPNQP